MDLNNLCPLFDGTLLGAEDDGVDDDDDDGSVLLLLLEPGLFNDECGADVKELVILIAD